MLVKVIQVHFGVYSEACLFAQLVQLTPSDVNQGTVRVFREAMLVREEERQL